MEVDIINVTSVPVASILFSVPSVPVMKKGSIWEVLLSTHPQGGIFSLYNP